MGIKEVVIIFEQLVEYVISAQVDVCRLSLPESQAIESRWRAIYGRAFIGRPRMRTGARAEDEYAQADCHQYYIVPFNFNVPGTPLQVTNRSQVGIECTGRLLPLSRFHAIEFFITPVELDWTMVHTHEDYSAGGPYFFWQHWIA